MRGGLNSHMQFEIGQIVEGKITGITNFGAFIDLGNKKSGMVHISEVASTFVKNISDFFQVGQIIKAKIINISNKGEIALSIKKAEENASLKKFSKTVSDKKSSGLSNFEWQSPKKKSHASFEDMLSMFKSASEEKISNLKKAIDSRRGSGSRRSSQNRQK